KKRDISFAWGPATDQNLKRIDRIEFTVASFVGGKGTVQIDNLKFEPLPPETNSWPAPSITASSSMKGHTSDFITDNNDSTYWLNRKTKSQNVTVDFRTKREFGGLLIKWLKGHHAKSFDILLSEDGKNWEKVYSVQSNRSDVSFIRLPQAEAVYLRINLTTPGNEMDFGIAGIKFPDLYSTLTPNDFLKYAAANSPAGNYPRYFSEQASYWTVTGVNNDVKEALISEDGTVEVDKGLFSIEPVLRVGDSLYNWSNVKPVQSMGFPHGGSGFVFLPSVTWLCNDMKFVTGVSSGGTANIDSRLNIGYSLANLSDQPRDIELYLLIRPFQVNPYYQFLNSVGGAGKINSISEEAGDLIVVDEKVILSTRQYDSFGAAVFDEGNIVDFIR
ncbi:MAG TPA: discoidin domain-containing protein, partial [Bacteroidales bacterium]|nr:discoidin domain-containing protein [Bacteroidales bacterium]